VNAADEVGRDGQVRSTGEVARICADDGTQDLIFAGPGEMRGAACDRRHRAVADVVLTARGGASAAAEGLAAGADDYLTKPFATPELLARARANYELNSLRERAIDVADTRDAQLRSALDSNRIIGTATGILTATHRLSAAQGFQLLTSARQDSNRKLRDLAVQVVEIGRLPFRPTAVDNLIIRVTTPRR